MMYRLLVIFGIMHCFVCQMSLSAYPCFKPTKTLNYRVAQSRIVGGNDALKRDTPYMAGLMRHGGVFCGASIVSEKHLITAGHCFCNNKNKVIKPTQLQAFVGLNKLSDIKIIGNEVDNEEQEIKEVIVGKIILHPDYDCSKRGDNDIALLQLNSQIKFSNSVRPLCLANDNEENFENETATVTGWGWTDENFDIGIKPDILQTANVPVWKNSDCQNSFDQLMLNKQISETQLCAGIKSGGVDSCWSDSGGPLISSKTGLLIGVVSTGVGCGRPLLPGVYTRIDKFTKWIHSNIYS